MKVTREMIEAKIRTKTFARGPGTVTMCYLAMDNSYTVVGSSACVDPIEFDETLGRQAAYEDAFDQLWPLVGFMLAEDRHRAVIAAEVAERLHPDNIVATRYIGGKKQ